MSRSVLVYGAGGMGREAAWIVERCSQHGNTMELAAFVDDDRHLQGHVVNGTSVLSWEDARSGFIDAQVVIAIGNPHVRQRLVERVAAAGFTSQSLVDPSVLYSPWVDIGEGALICPGCVITVNCSIGRHVQINLDCTISHDVVIGDYVTMAPGVRVSGNVQIGNGVQIGTGANIINGTPDQPLLIGEGSVIGAGACVIRSVGAGQVVVGVPARPVGPGA